MIEYQINYNSKGGKLSIMQKVVENIYCKECRKETKHMFVGKNVPPKLRWKCSECGWYNDKEGGQDGSKGRR